MSDSDYFCPLLMIAIAAGGEGFFQQDGIGIDCPRSKKCALWDTYTNACGLSNSFLNFKFGDLVHAEQWV